MTREKEYFIELLSAFLEGRQPEGRTVDWAEIYRLADIHDVGGIIAQEIKLLEAEFRPKQPYLSYFNQVLGRTLQSDIKREQALTEITDMLNEWKVGYLLVKGAVVKDYYPVPSLRTSGDIDVIVEKLQLERLYHSALQQGITVSDYVSHTLTLAIHAVHVEIHDGADVISHYFDDIFHLADTDDGYRYSLNEYDQLLYVLCHLAKHIAYRGAGVRMLMDLDAMIRNTEGFDVDRFLLMCADAKVQKTAEILLSLCHKWFHTPIHPFIQFNDEPTLLANLETVLLDGGSFGYEVNAIPARYLSENGNRFGVLLKMAFPSREYLKICYPYYQKHALLYPVARVHRLLDGVFKKRSAARDAISQVQSDTDTSVQLELIRELGINNNVEK